MYRIAISVVIASAFLWLGTSRAETPTDKDVKIPLDKVWAFRMPGTVDLATIDKPVASREIESIRRVLSMPTAQGKDAKAAFVVLGTGLKAIHEAHAVLVDGKKPRETIPKDSEASVVFFSYEFGRYVHLHSVERHGNSIEIKYEFVPHKSKELTEHFAVMPLGKLPAGTLRVDIVELPMPQQLIAAGWKPISADVSRGVVCRSFSFVVK
jgi:hypothetical protein